MRTASRPFLLRFFAPAQCVARETGTDRLRRAFNRLIMLDFGDGPVRGRCAAGCLASRRRFGSTVDRLWMKDDRNPNICLPFDDNSIYFEKYIEGRGAGRRHVVNSLHESRKRF
ncbi:hypothetical protein VL15_24845 [Burkholderia cepacia]|uniref:Uncharacterized protein n=1 Tax=Burkholderia cepacia TaxID=292 RepID=A0A0J5WNU2_BURCE|nr:hypothetical protein [Burkholderia cepacia]KML52557.1 hypothetical protein VL15_24845 [Burkholderia cepacia]